MDMSSQTILSHKKYTDKQFVIENNKLNLPKNIVESGDLESLDFVVKYINYINKNKEADSPEYPLEVHLNVALKSEEDIFIPLLELENDTEENMIKKIEFAIKIGLVANELDLITLFKKMSAVIYHYMQNIELKKNILLQ